ncbi:hypothetical protein yc1106_00082 [Curvularia clavata]|uniref:Peptidase C14 caspase domain-containing protein n=1 Tax=Curvularia clavata TaxID=95742 RepID=A0A9Q8Z1U8_CURCL|nr:hypothetical protein yc1106_00082 [Curvularia clavata]
MEYYAQNFDVPHTPPLSPSGAKRALLIGSPTGGLSGPETDLVTIEQVLRRYSFSCTICFLEGRSKFPATRNGIFAAWEQLLQQTSPGDAVVIYYSGHGGLFEKDKNDVSNKRWRLQFIVPLDFDRTTPGDFRGITDVEISSFLMQLTKRTDNVTVILDCCHSANMARGPTRAKALLPRDYPEVWRHIQAMLHQKTIGTDFFLEGNPNVVRFVGATASGSAYEKTFSNGRCMGAFTEAITEALELALHTAPYTQLSWRRILDHVRDRMSRTLPEQYVDVEGPAKRFCFTTSLETQSESLPISMVRGGVDLVLAGGWLHGVSNGDRYAILPYNEYKPTSAKRIATAKVRRVGVSYSEVSVEWEHRFNALPEGAHAILCGKALNRLPIAVHGDGQLQKAMVSHIDQSKYLRNAEPSEQISSLAIVRKENSNIEMKTSVGILRRWAVESADELQQAVEKSMTVLTNLAKAQHLLTLKSRIPWNHGLKVEYGFVDGGVRRPLTDPNYVLSVGQRIYISTRNTSRATVFVWIFELLADNVVLLSNLTPSGREIPAGGHYKFGEVDLTDKLIGSELLWPNHVPADQEIHVNEVVVVTDRMIDLHCLETDSTLREHPKHRERIETELEDIVEQIGHGGVRTWQESEESYKPLKFDVMGLSYKLTPRERHQNTKDG